MPKEHVDLRTAADLLGVHYQTAYKWVRAGTLDAELVAGSYRLDPATVAAFAEKRATPKPPPARTPRQGFGPLAEEMFDKLMAGDEREARRCINELVTEGVTLVEAIEGVISPALRQLGVEWAEGRITVAVEHRATAVVERILSEHHPNPRGRRRGTALVVAVAGERHTLATSMASAALRQDNWKVHHLGSDVPVSDLVRFCRTEPFDLAVLTVTIPETEAEAERAATALEGLGIPTLVGGPGKSLEALIDLARTARIPSAD